MNPRSDPIDFTLFYTSEDTNTQNLQSGCNAFLALYLIGQDKAAAM